MRWWSGCGRTHNQVDPIFDANGIASKRIGQSKDRVKIVLDHTTNLLSFDEIVVHCSSTQAVGPKKDPPSHLGSKVVVAMSSVQGVTIFRRRRCALRAVSDTVVFGQVGRRLGRGEDIIRRQGMFRGGQGDGDDFVPSRLQKAQGRSPCPTNHWMHFGNVILQWNANPPCPRLFFWKPFPS